MMEIYTNLAVTYPPGMENYGSFVSLKVSLSQDPREVRPRIPASSGKSHIN